MTIQQLRGAHRAAPFEPFTIHMADGRSLLVPHPDFLAMTPIGRTAIVFEADDEMHIVDLLLMTEIETNQSSPTQA